MLLHRGSSIRGNPPARLLATASRPTRNQHHGLLRELELSDHGTVVAQRPGLVGIHGFAQGAHEPYAATACEVCARLRGSARLAAPLNPHKTIPSGSLPSPQPPLGVALDHQARAVDRIRPVTRPVTRRPASCDLRGVTASGTTTTPISASAASSPPCVRWQPADQPVDGSALPKAKAWSALTRSLVPEESSRILSSWRICSSFILACI